MCLGIRTIQLFFDLRQQLQTVSEMKLAAGSVLDNVSIFQQSGREIYHVGSVSWPTRSSLENIANLTTALV